MIKKHWVALSLLAACSGPVFSMALSEFSASPDISLKGNMLGRWIWGNTAEFAPYHSALVFDVIPTLKIHDELAIEYSVRIENPSVSDGYEAKQRIQGRAAVLSEKYGITFRGGNLHKVTVGNGLTLKNLEADGFQIQGSPMEATVLGLTYIAHGYSDPGDYVVGSLINGKSGVYWLAYVDDGAYFRTYENVLGLYTTVDVLPFLDLALEATLPAGALVSPRLHYENPQTKISLVATGRYYSRALNTPFQQFPFEKTYHGLEEEDQDFDNWRNYLLNTMSNPQDAKGLSARIKIDRQIWEPFWLYGDWDVSRQYYASSSIDISLLAYGLQLRLNPQQFFYFGAQNRMLESFGVTEKKAGSPPPYDRDNFPSYNAPVITQVASFFVMGTKATF